MKHCLGDLVVADDGTLGMIYEIWSWDRYNIYWHVKDGNEMIWPTYPELQVIRFKKNLAHVLGVGEDC